LEGRIGVKRILFVIDGAADEPIGELGGKTPLQAANKPNLDALCAKSRLGLLETIPDGLPASSDVGNLSLLGYDVRQNMPGRGPLEAAAMGIRLAEDEVAMRCNLSTQKAGNMEDYSGGHVSTPEAAELIAELNAEFLTPAFRLCPGVSYRHVLILKGKEFSEKVETFPPHDHPGKPLKGILPRESAPEGKETARVLNEFIRDAMPILENSAVNKARSAEGKRPANLAWPWSPGRRPAMKTYQELYGLSGAVISAVDIVFGIGILAGMDPVKVKGATGLWDTNYEGKAREQAGGKEACH
jgi:2,3-bisphosphoglycerate-independent phosphoglycerate mutase